MANLKTITTKLSTVQTIIATLVLLLPLLGANLGSFYDWSVKVYNLRDELNSMQKETDTLEVLLYIEEALYNDVTDTRENIKYFSEELAKLEKVEIADEKGIAEQQVLIDNLYKAYDFRVLKLQRMRLKIKSLDPEWKTKEELDNEHED